MNSLYEPIKKCVVEHFNIPADVIHPDITLEDLGLDSLAVVELVCVLKDELGLRAPAGEELASLRNTFGQAVAVVERAQEATGTPVQPATGEPVPSA
ncbi:acyl carrier protein [Streptomyces sp. ISL-11]|uniref:acyl carrier protein n=1 Tax=Streptomyces sp. ISL-11 TaxID=2819174 RepID=UPI001BEB82D3|nr:phosphopantetheine-binding protein [Streptomyces sp. ISL-11]MBT2383310.1 acyl carrier protein [Streptomyces sp. ISL-11]